MLVPVWTCVNAQRVHLFFEKRRFLQFLNNEFFGVKFFLGELTSGLRNLTRFMIKLSIVFEVGAFKRKHVRSDCFNRLSPFSLGYIVGQVFRLAV